MIKLALQIEQSSTTGDFSIGNISTGITTETFELVVEYTNNEGTTNVSVETVIENEKWKITNVKDGQYKFILNAYVDNELTNSIDVCKFTVYNSYICLNKLLIESTNCNNCNDYINEWIKIYTQIKQAEQLNCVGSVSDALCIISNICCNDESK